VIVALAGRRIDAPNAAIARFPLSSVAVVRDRISSALRKAEARVLVCAAACGADLMALSVAEELGLRRRIVLPSDVSAFRANSVADRPGEWTGIYDRMIAAARSSGDLELLDLRSTGGAAYLETNAAILNRALALAHESGQEVRAFAVWDGPLTGHTDYTRDFVKTAQRLSIPVSAIEIQQR
jgi:hypothetical protein